MASSPPTATRAWRATPKPTSTTALHLPWIPPELREMRGEFDAAEAGALPTLVTRADLRGDLHCHTTESDGKDSLAGHGRRGTRARGFEYLAITDHSQALAMANGLDEGRALAHAARIRALDARYDDITLLAGIECDIRARRHDGSGRRMSRAARYRGGVGALGADAGRGDDDRPGPPRPREPVRRHPGTPDRTHAVAARRLAARRRAGRGGGPTGTAWHSKSTASRTGAT